MVPRNATSDINRTHATSHAPADRAAAAGGPAAAGQAASDDVDRSGAGRWRVALAHDWLVSMRGGDRVLDRLAQRFGPTDLFVMCRQRRSRSAGPSAVDAAGGGMSPAIEACRIHTSLLDRLPGGGGRLRRWYLPLYPLAVESLVIPREAAFDLVLSTSSAMIKSIRPPRSSGPGGAAGRIPHLCYCHSPARYIWSRRDDYRVGAGGRLRAAGLALFNPALRWYDRRTAHRVTRFIANSTHTAEEIARCFGRDDAIVIPPPVRTAYFTPGLRAGAAEDADADADAAKAVDLEVAANRVVDDLSGGGPFLLVASALEPYKRIDLAIDAANRLGRRLIVTGTGSQAAWLAARAGPTVRMAGFVPDAVLRALYRRASVLLFPWAEDFGIVPVEAMACGCPVIALAGGGARDWLDPAATRAGSDRVAGVVFDRASVDGVVEAIERFEGSRDGLGISVASCRRNALRFSEERFDAAILQALDEVMQGRVAGG